jgi:hypothetical protein
MFEFLVGLRDNPVIKGAIDIAKNPVVNKTGSIATKIAKAAKGDVVKTETASSPTSQKWWQQLTSVYSMPFTQKAIALALTLTPFIGGASLLSVAEVAFGVTVVAAMHFKETTQYIHKQKLTTEVKYIGDYQKSEKTLEVNKDLATKLGISFSKPTKEVSSPQKEESSKLKAAKAIALGGADLVKTAATSALSFDVTFMVLTAFELALEGKSRYSKAYEGHKVKNEVEEILQRAKELMPDFKSPLDIVMQAKGKKVEALALEALLKKHPKLTGDNFSEEHKNEFEKLKNDARKKLSEEKDGMYSDKKIAEVKKLTESFVTAAIKAAKAGKDSITEYQSLKESEEFKKVQQMTAAAQAEHKKQQAQQKTEAAQTERKQQKAQQTTRTVQAEQKKQEAQPSRKKTSIRRPAAREAQLIASSSKNHKPAKGRG